MGAAVRGRRLGRRGAALLLLGAAAPHGRRRGVLPGACADAARAHRGCAGGRGAARRGRPLAGSARTRRRGRRRPAGTRAPTSGRMALARAGRHSSCAARDRRRAPPGYAAERAHAFDVVFKAILGVGYEARETRRATPVVSPARRESCASRTCCSRPHRALADRARAAGNAAGARRRAAAADSAGGDLDVFGSAFFMATRYEEAVVGERDEHDRFPPPPRSPCAKGSRRGRSCTTTPSGCGRSCKCCGRGWSGRAAARLQPSHDIDWPSLPALAARRAAHARRRPVLRRDLRLARDRASWELRAGAAAAARSIRHVRRADGPQRGRGRAQRVLRPRRRQLWSPTMSHRCYAGSTSAGTRLACIRATAASAAPT